MKNVRIVSLIYGYSARNAGDFAITLGAIDLLLSLGIKVKLFSRYTYKDRDYMSALEALRCRYGNQIGVYESPFNLNRSDSPLRNLKNYVKGFLIILGIIKNRNFKSALLKSDIVIFNGGNLFRCNSLIDFTRLIALMYPLKIALKNGLPVLVFPQSASKLNEIGRRLLLPILKQSSLVMFREKESYDYLNTFIASDNFFQSIDLAFFIDKTKLPDSSYRLKDRKNIAVTLRFHTVGDIAYLPETEINFYLTELGKVVEELKKEHNILLVVQTEKDFVKSVEFSNRFRLPILQLNDVPELIALYKQMDVLIGMRLHSIILALSVGTPCVGLFYKQWGLKNPGLMKYFDMPFFFWDSRPEAKMIIKEVNRLVDNRSILSEGILNTVLEEESVIKEKLSQIMHLR